MEFRRVLFRSAPVAHAGHCAEPAHRLRQRGQGRQEGLRRQLDSAGGGRRARPPDRGPVRGVGAARRHAGAAPPEMSDDRPPAARSEEHTSELQSLMRISYAVFCLKKKNKQNNKHTTQLSYTTNHMNTKK